MHTVNYVVNQTDYTVQILRNVTQYLSLAKYINVAEMLLPSDIMNDIDNLNMDLNNAADTLSEKTTENSIKIQKAFDVVYAILNFTLFSLDFNLGIYVILNFVHFRSLVLIVMAAIMLLFAVTGLSMYMDDNFFYILR